jgi:hypothetical protein
MAFSRVRIGIEASKDQETGALESKRQPATPREKIEDAWCVSLLQPRDLGPDIVVSP